MKVIENELIVFCDVDETLIKWDKPTIKAPDKLALPYAGETVYVTPHHYHVQLVKMYKERGYFVVVWSANGFQHAKNAVTSLQLEKYVDLAMSKPTKHMDDNPNAASILGPRVFEEDITKPQVATIVVPYGMQSIDGFIWEK